MSRKRASRTFNPRKSPLQQRSRERVERILEATRTILREHGASALTTSRIAEQAGVPVGSVYQYFPNKQAVLLALYDDYLADIRTALARFDEQRYRTLGWRDFFAALLRAVKHREQRDTRDFELYRSILLHPELQPIEERHTQTTVAFMADHMQRLGARGSRAKLERLARFSYELNNGVWLHQMQAASARARNESIEWEVLAIMSVFASVFPERAAGE